MNKIKKIKYSIDRILDVFKRHHTGAYAAQAAYFFVLSLIPIIWLLMTLVRYTPIKMDEMMKAVLMIFPESVSGFIRTIVWEVYNQSSTLIPVTVLIALWSAGKGVLSVSSGLNAVYECSETRNYIYLRIRASFYTLLFLLAIVLSLILSVFGNRISIIVYKYAPFLSHVMSFIIKTRTLLTLAVLTVFWDLVYRFLPNRKHQPKTTWKRQLPGAIVTSCGWLLISFIFSIYLDIFTGFSTMYGSLTTIILIMLWLYMCMYVILIGAELNAILEGIHNYSIAHVDKEVNHGQ